MVKRILSVLLTAALLLSLAGCAGQTAAKLPELTVPEGELSAARPAPADSDYEDTLEGLLSYMEKAEAVIKDDTENSFTEMAYREIGAAGGFRYRFTYNKNTVQAEFYEFDLSALDKKGQENLSMAGEKGFITVLGKNVNVTLHPNGRYMMIYSDSKAEKEEANKAQAERTKELFLKFHA